MVQSASPLSRQESQLQTREALVVAAREAFATVGYHGANLEFIAREAGYSKGAVYSNFDGKAALFLAVMDANLEAAMGDGGWDVFEHSHAQEETPHTSEEVEAVKGFALATLEFIATAARDDALAAELGKRMQAVTEAYVAVAEESRSEDDQLTATEAGALLTALDQGAALLTLSGSATIDQRVLRIGMQRLIDPSREGSPDSGEPAGEPALHDEVVRRRIAATLKQHSS